MPLITVGGTGHRLGQALLDRRWPVRDVPGWLPGPVEDALLRRSSVREFSADPLPAARVRSAADAARLAETVTWPARSHGAASFEVLVAAFNVGGLARGLYPAHGSIRLDAPDCEWLGSLRGQYADAPALLLICGDLNQACRAAGPGGYASMLVRAGTIGCAAWLWAVSAGLAASVYGSASHRVSFAARQLNADLRHLFTVALGTPARPGQIHGHDSDHHAD
jgi:hypothetical protein